MSIEAMVWAWNLDIPCTQKMVLLALADQSNYDGVCSPGVKGLAQKCSLTERGVQKEVSTLETDGLLVREFQWDETGRQSRNLYVLQIDPRGRVNSVQGEGEQRTPGRVNSVHPPLDHHDGPWAASVPHDQPADEAPSPLSPLSPPSPLQSPPLTPPYNLPLIPSLFSSTPLTPLEENEGDRKESVRGNLNNPSKVRNGTASHEHNQEVKAHWLQELEAWSVWRGFSASAPDRVSRLTVWLEDHRISAGQCEQVATALRGKWDGKRWKDPIATFKNWCLREAVRSSTGLPLKGRPMPYTDGEKMVREQKEWMERG